MSVEAGFDVFLSYASADSEWVRALARELVNQRIKFFLATHELDPGEDFVLGLSEALERSRFLVLVLSPASVDRPWVLREWTSFLAANGPAGRLLPLVLKPVKIPAIIASLQTIDATHRDPLQAAKEIARLVAEPLRLDTGQAGTAALRQQQDLSWLHLPAPSWRSDRSAPGALLRPEYEAVPFHGREEELIDFRDWCMAPLPIGVRLYTGQGGMGKTRLLLKTCRSLVEEGWRAGFLTDPSPLRTAAEWTACLNCGDATLVVVDYAEHRREDLLLLLSGVFSVDAGKVRIALLARSAGDWWDRLRSEGNGVDQLLKSHISKVRELLPLATSPESRERSILTAARAFAAALGKPEPKIGIQRAEIVEPLYRRVLFLHMQALAAVLGSVIRGEKGVLDFILGRERRYWEKLAKAMRLPPHVWPAIPKAMAAFTLGGGVGSRRNAVDLLCRLPWFEGQPATVLASIADLLHDASPGERWIEPLSPDLLGEHLLATELDSDDLDAVFALFDRPSHDPAAP